MVRAKMPESEIGDLIIEVRSATAGVGSFTFKFDHMAERIAALISSQNRLLADISHELRSPLNAISGYAQLLEQDSSLNTKPRDQVRVVRRSADHLSGLIDGILDISKIEAGRLYLSRDEVRLSEFLDQLVGMFRVQSASKGIDFVFRRPAVLPVVVYADWE